MMRNHQLLPWLASMLAVLTLSGCMGDTTGDLREWVRQERKNAKPNIQPLSEPKAFTPQPYTTADLMDPFNVLKLTSALRLDSEKNTANTNLLEQELNRRKQELESFPLDAISMVGSMHQNGSETALVRVNKQVYQVKAGGYMGQNYGRIEKISESAIRLREIVQDPAGDWVDKTTILELQEETK